MPKLPVTRLTLGVVGLLLCSLPLTGTSLVGSAGTSPADADLELASRSCGGFGPRDVLRGSAGRNGRTCRPVGLDAGIVHSPLAKARKRDRHNFHRRAHGVRRHLGTDYRARCGAKVRAAHNGKAVVLKGSRRGRTVGVSTGPGRLTTWYGHLRRVTVRNGAMVKGGRVIGAVGRGGTRRCLLHFSVHLRGGSRDPGRVNPSAWMRKHGRTHVSGLAPGKRRKGVFITATLNVLGHSHTARGGEKHRRFAGSSRRMTRAVGLLASNGVSLVGLQELQPEQRRMFLRKTRGWKLFSPRDPQDSIAWRKSRFRLVRATTFRIPYFRTWRTMPAVVLRDRGTGRKVVVISVHNPADRGRLNRHKRRAEAVRRELKMVKVMRRRTHAPVILMGDFNDKSRALYCRVVRHGLKASSGGVRGRRCRPNQVAGIDWIFGTSGIRFTGHQRVQGGLVSRATDHPLVLARVRR